MPVVREATSEPKCFHYKYLCIRTVQYTVHFCDRFHPETSWLTLTKKVKFKLGNMPLSKMIYIAVRLSKPLITDN